jgi:hypothetical protein
MLPGMKGERRGAAVLGTILIVIGGAFLAANVVGLDLAEAWPLFIVVPGLVLFVAACAVGGEPGTGLAIAGAIVTTVGLVLAVQAATDLYETWAYAWALVAPGSVGLALIVYGLATGQPDLVKGGLPTLAVGLGLFLAFAIFFEGVIGLSGDRVPELQRLLPFGLLALGAALVVGSLLGRRSS